MAIRKRNEFFDNDESDDGHSSGYDSEANERGRAAMTNTASKRRKLKEMHHATNLLGQDHDDGDGGGHMLELALQVPGHGIDLTVPATQGESSDRDSLIDEPAQEDTAAVPLPSRSTRGKAVRQAIAAEKSVRKSGVLYISRVPPFMKPHTLRHFLEPHATKGLGKIFLTPEDHAAHTRRVRSGGNKKKSFTDGWVEFKSKTEAKTAAATLNGNIIGGKKGNFYHDDLWNVKYLKGFKWQHLTEQIANENAERAARLREEIRKTQKDNKAFLEDVERAKMIERMEEKKKASHARESDVTAPHQTVDRPIRRFTQQKVHSTSTKSDLVSTQPTRVLRKVF